MARTSKILIPKAIVLRNENEFFLPFMDSRTYSHMFKAEEAERVASVVKYLQSREAEVYLTGSIPRYHIFGHDAITEATDIDLVAVMDLDRQENLDSTNLITELERAKRRKSTVINDYGFLVSEDPMKRLMESYANMHRVASPLKYPTPRKYNFSLTPIKAIDEGMEKRPRTLDLTVIKKGLFKRNTR